MFPQEHIHDIGWQRARLFRRQITLRVKYKEAWGSNPGRLRHVLVVAKYVFGF